MRIERRRYPRKKAGPNTVVACYGAGIDLPASRRINLAVKAVDVGGKGACIVTVGRLREGLPLIIEIALPDAHERFRAKGIVRWSQTWVHKSREANVAGVEFMEVLEACGERVQFLAQGCRKPAAPRGEELRREHRKSLLQQAELVCRPKGFWSALGFGCIITGRLAHLTPAGFRMISRTKLPQGKRVEVRMDFQSPRTFVAAEAEIRECRRDTLVLEPRYEVDAEFTKVLPENRERLDEVLRLMAPHSSEGPSDR